MVLAAQLNSDVNDIKNVIALFHYVLKSLLNGGVGFLSIYTLWISGWVPLISTVQQHAFTIEIEIERCMISWCCFRMVINAENILAEPVEQASCACVL
jgi:hypothetical protein